MSVPNEKHDQPYEYAIKLKEPVPGTHRVEVPEDVLGTKCIAIVEDGWIVGLHTPGSANDGYGMLYILSPIDHSYHRLELFCRIAIHEFDCLFCGHHWHATDAGPCPECDSIEAVVCVRKEVEDYL